MKSMVFGHSVLSSKQWQGAKAVRTQVYVPHNTLLGRAGGGMSELAKISKVAKKSDIVF